MTFKINIECETAAEAIAELIHAASFYKANPEIAEAPTRVKRAPKADVKESAPAADPTPASSSPDPAAAPAADSSPSPEKSTPVPQSESAVTVSEVRAFLTPFLSDPDQAPRVTGLIRDVGGVERLSGVSPANLPKLLAAAKEMFA